MRFSALFAPTSDASRLVDSGQTVGLQHVRQRHPGAASPDLNNPAGYRRLNGYECELEGEEIDRRPTADGPTSPHKRARA